MSQLDELLAQEQAGWEALSAGRGGDFYASHLAEQAVMVFPFGVLGREDALSSMNQAPPWSSYTISDAQVVPLGAESATLVYRVVAQRAGDEKYEAMINSTFVRSDGQWLLALHQQTPVA